MTARVLGMGMPKTLGYPNQCNCGFCNPRLLEKLGEKFAFAIYTFPIINLVCPLNLCIAFVYYFYRVLQSSQEKYKTMVIQIFWGADNVYYWRCENGQCFKARDPLLFKDKLE